MLMNKHPNLNTVEFTNVNESMRACIVPGIPGLCKER